MKNEVQVNGEQLVDKTIGFLFLTEKWVTTKAIVFLFATEKCAKRIWKDNNSFFKFATEKSKILNMRSHLLCNYIAKFKF